MYTYLANYFFNEGIDLLYLHNETKNQTNNELL
jgi:hypothetical protein